MPEANLIIAGYNIRIMIKVIFNTLKPHDSARTFEVHDAGRKNTNPQ